MKMGEQLHIVTTYVLPSGISQKQVADGFITCRVCLGHIWAPGGVLAELNGEMEGTHFESGSHPVPWVSKQVRSQAAEEAARMPGLKPELREQLAAHIKRSAYFEDPQ
jgi:hypothetical protein